MSRAFWYFLSSDSYSSFNIYFLQAYAVLIDGTVRVQGFEATLNRW